MKHAQYNDWNAYWAEFNNLDELQKKYDNLDETLISLAKECNTKLLTGDHLLIIEALENRIEQLQKMTIWPDSKESGQLALFAL